MTNGLIIPLKHLENMKFNTSDSGVSVTPLNPTLTLLRCVTLTQTLLLKTTVNGPG